MNTQALLCIGLGLASYASAQEFIYGPNPLLPVVFDNEVVSEAFPDIDIELISPHFLNPERSPEGFSNGTGTSTSLTELDYFVRSIADRNDWITYQLADFRSEEGRPVPYIYISESTAAQPSMNSSKLRVYIQAAIHGNEPAADEGALAFLGKLDANQTYAASLLEKMDFLILPRFNLDGAAYFQRRTAGNLDANRDAVKHDSPQVREIWRRYHEFDCHIMIDMHEFGAPNTYGEDGAFQHASDALLGLGDDLNVHPEIRRLGNETFLPAIQERLDAYGLRSAIYATSPQNTTFPTWTAYGQGGRFSTGAAGLSQSVAILFETRGIRIANQHFQRRVATQLIKLEAVLETARDYEGLYEILEDARADFVDSDEDIVVTDSTFAFNTTFPLIRSSNGSIEDVPIRFVQTAASPNLTRSRPEAYLIPRPWSRIVDRLEVLGVQAERLDYEYRGTVEALTITNSTLASSLFEGAVANTVITESSTREVQLPAGSFLVSTRQKNAALAFAVLEPEALDSYVAFNIIPLAVGNEYPIFRIPRE